MFLDREGAGTLQLQAGRTPGDQRGQRPVLPPLCELCEQDGNGGRTTVSRRGSVSRVN